MSTIHVEYAVAYPATTTGTELDQIKEFGRDFGEACGFAVSLAARGIRWRPLARTVTATSWQTDDWGTAPHEQETPTDD